jgi:hypothetical protein
MTKEAYLIIAIVILVALLVTFIVSFVLYRKTPVPKGCENIEINEENCSHCSHKECSHFIKRDEE